MSDEEHEARLRNPFVDGEAQDEDDEEENSYRDSSEEDDEDDEADAEDVLGFFVADEDPDDGSGGEADADESAPRKKKKRRRSDVKDHELDEDDLDLIEDNTGHKIQRRGMKRLKKREAVESGDQRGNLQRNILGDSDDNLDIEDDLGDEDLDMDHQQLGDPEMDDDDDDEMGDFIVQEHGTDADHKAHRAAMRQRAKTMGISAEAAQEIQDIFGGDRPLDDLIAEFEEQQQMDDEYDEPDLLDDEYPPEEAANLRRVQKTTAAADPTLLESHFLTQDDDEIRATDLPEREQLRRRETLPENLDLDKCAEWVYRHVFSDEAPNSMAKSVVEEGMLEMDGVDSEAVKNASNMFENVGTDTATVNTEGFRLLRKARMSEYDPQAADLAWSTVQNWRQDSLSQDALKTAILNVLRHTFKSHYEIPVVAMFCKENCGELLSVRDSDCPTTCTADDAMQWESQGIFVAAGAVLAYGRAMRRHDVLWAVHNASHRWCSLQREKEAKARLLQKTEGLPEATKLEIDLECVDTLEELEDWCANFRLVQQRNATDRSALDDLGLDDDAPVSQRRPNRERAYQKCIQYKLDQLAQMLALSADDFAQNVETIGPRDTDAYLVVPVIDDRDSSPIEKALKFCVAGSPFPDPQSCLKGAKHVMVHDLAAHPKIRAVVRTLYKRLAVVSTEPTEAGEVELDPFHVHGNVKRIRNKPLSVLSISDQFLSMVTAEKKNLIKVRMEIPEAVLEERVIKQFAFLYCTDEVHAISCHLNELRMSVLRDLFTNHLIPLAARETRLRLIQEARAHVLQQMSDELWRHAKMPPLRLKCTMDEDAETLVQDSTTFVSCQRVMAVCYGDGHTAATATHMVMLDSRGYPIDVLALPQMSGRIPRRRNLNGEMYDLSQDPMKSKAVDDMHKFLFKHWPHLIVIGATSLDCRQLQDDIKEICSRFDQEQKQNSLMETKEFEVRLVDESVAALCQDATFYLQDMKEFAPIVRRAAALGRITIDPLAVLCSLASNKCELLALQLHPLQDQVPEELRRCVLEQILVTSVAQIGVNLNACVHMDWLAQALPFVPGLGPRKARALIKSIKQLPEQAEQVVESRECLLAIGTPDDEDDDDQFSSCRILGRRVYKNAAPFLRICEHPAISSLENRDFEIQNDMRIFPDDMDTLMELSRISLDKRADDQSIPNPAQLAVTKHEGVHNLDLSLFAKQKQEAEGSASTRLSLYIDIQMELIQPYGDLRLKSRRPMTELEEFYALTGECERSCRKGKPVNVHVGYVGRTFAKCRLENGLDARLELQGVRTYPPESMSDVLQVDQQVFARIWDVSFAEFSVLILSRSDEVADPAVWEWVYCNEYDKYYYVQTEEEKRAHARAKSGGKRKPFVSRPIKHSLFSNISVIQAEQELNEVNRAQQICIFRPSQKSTDRLQASIRLYSDNPGQDSVIHHIDIIEAPKKASAGQHLVLSCPLTIPFSHLMKTTQGKDSTTFEDLDEVFTGFVEPYVRCIHSLRANRKFAKGNRDAVDKFLLEKDYTSDMDYLMGLHPDNPGHGFISWVNRKSSSKKVHHIPFSVSHMGFYMALPESDDHGQPSHRSVESKTADIMIKHFKHHMLKVLQPPSRDHRDHRDAHHPRVHHNHNHHHHGQQQLYDQHQRGNTSWDHPPQQHQGHAYVR